MTRDQYIEKIRKACIEANHEIHMCQRCEKSPPIQSDFCGDGLAHNIISRSIRLAAVLLAIGGNYGVMSDGAFMRLNYDASFLLGIGATQVYWNLRKDDLTEQSDDCVEFIASLL